MQGWLEHIDLSDFYQRAGTPEVAQRDASWRVFADILIAASVYE